MQLASAADPTPEPHRDPPDIPFRRIALPPAPRSVVIPLSATLHLGFDPELLRTIVVWTGPGLNLYGQLFDDGLSGRFTCDFDGPAIWTHPSPFPWSIGGMKQDERKLPSFARFDGVSTKGGHTTLLYSLTRPNGKAIKIQESPRSLKLTNGEAVVRRFELGPSDEELWFLAHAELEGKFVEMKNPVSALINREENSLLTVLRSDAGMVWEKRLAKVDFSHDIWMQKEFNAVEIGLMQIPCAGTEARCYVRIPAHTNDLAFEVVTMIAPADGAKELAIQMAKPPLATPDLNFLSSSNRAPTESAPPEFFASKTEARRVDGNASYHIEHFPLPKDFSLRVTGMDFMSNGDLAVCTWDGEVYIVKKYQGNVDDVVFRRFARGLSEPLGLKVIKDKIYVTQKCELTRLTDTDNNGAADLFETINSSWGYTGHFHAFAMGPLADAAGNLYVFLNGAFQIWEVQYMGWCLKLSPDGRQTTPVCSGLRSPNGFATYGPDEDIFVTDNQGHWVGACKLNHVQPGKFFGFPSAKPLPVETFRSPTNFHLPAVWIPYSLARSVSGAVVIPDDRFGPFKGQMLVGEFQNSLVLRIALEKVRGQWQGAVWPFEKGFSSGVNRLVMGADGKLYVGGGKGGLWATAVGPQLSSLDRVTFTGKVPFEVKEAHATRDGFELVFTQPVKAEQARETDNYAVAQFSYYYMNKYGSPELDHDGKENAQTSLQVLRAVVSEDRLKVRLSLGGTKAGFITSIHVGEVHNDAGEPVRHNKFWYTLNQIPEF